MDTEKVPLAYIYKKNGYIRIDFTRDSDKGFELYGFLECLLRRMGVELEESMTDKEVDENE